MVSDCHALYYFISIISIDWPVYDAAASDNVPAKKKYLEMYLFIIQNLVLYHVYKPKTCCVMNTTMSNIHITEPQAS